jgi:hypothetical protein
MSSFMMSNFLVLDSIEECAGPVHVVSDSISTVAVERTAAGGGYAHSADGCWLLQSTSLQSEETLPTA